MKNKPTDKGLVAAIVVSVLLILGSLGYLFGQINGGLGSFGSDGGYAEFDGKVRPVSAKYDHILGDLKAPISLIEYSDYECPFCKKFHPTAKEILKKYDGKVKWIYRHYPLSFHEPKASEKAMAAECVAKIAGNEAFWQFTDAMYERDPAPAAANLAKELGVKEEAFQKCVSEGDFKKRIEQDIADSKKAEIEGTPGNIIFHDKTGKYEIIAGAYPYEEFQKAIDKLLSEN